MRDELMAFIAARRELERERVAHAESPPDAAGLAVDAAESLVTGPFLLGDFDHLRETDPEAFTAARLKALAADERKRAAWRAASDRKAALAKLETDYTAAAVRLAEAVAKTHHE